MKINFITVFLLSVPPSLLVAYVITPYVLAHPSCWGYEILTAKGDSVWLSDQVAIFRNTFLLVCSSIWALVVIVCLVIGRRGENQ